eukprot:CAMPEP_0113962306 /NCGR_PEP_ID=MMETSP0011_2-20120614/5838_1 /TAXON_ID=101924 /ORGANISM="Rhodosorus marinus" /LENGTH=103 /DNA_ID=CAMNT_0000974137 /DNA_START=2824 /DNA_END=3136 /DNA_ORIENTATION=+ /assembly_acc=CAM_ASM_000156
MTTARLATYMQTGSQAGFTASEKTFLRKEADGVRFDKARGVYTRRGEWLNAHLGRARKPVFFLTKSTGAPHWLLEGVTKPFAMAPPAASSALAAPMATAGMAV